MLRFIRLFQNSRLIGFSFTRSLKNAWVWQGHPTKDLSSAYKNYAKWKETEQMCAGSQGYHENGTCFWCGKPK